MTQIENHSRLTLQTPVEHLDGIGTKRLDALNRLGIVAFGDLLLHLPADYQDRTRFTPVSELEEGCFATVHGEIVESRNVRMRGNQNMALVRIKDATGTVSATLFGRGYLAQSTLRAGRTVVASGIAGQYKGMALRNPDIEVMENDDTSTLNTGRIVPIYRLTEGITQRMLRHWIHTALGAIQDWGNDPLPVALREQYAFGARAADFATAHFPDTLDAAHAARRRFAYEELLQLQLRILRVRAQRLHREQGIRHRINGPHLKALHNLLPFALTGAQERAISDILADMATPRPMARLLQGDVGCGKTIVALHALAAATDGGYQAALMAPTEVLAEQHHLSLRPYLDALGLRATLLTGTMRDVGARRAELANGQTSVAIGTQALIQDSTTFQNLGLVIVDEQHRFGVVQRDALVKKGVFPDILQMSATPIPRTLAITLFGALDITVIDELPPGRQPVKTRYIPADKEAALYDWVREQAALGRQAYVVCPLVELSDAREQKAVLDHYEELTAGPLAGVRTGLLHGRLDASEKEAVMAAFKSGALQVLVATTVIEVGVDVPNASIMVIEDASQFGLTQLHQLRGRVGRGTEESFCFLVGKPRTPEGKARLEILQAKSSGFDIAEADLKMRGPGEIFGKRQAGIPDLRVADLMLDARLLDLARRDAQAILDKDPDLELTR